MTNVTAPLVSLREQRIFCVRLHATVSGEVPSIEKAMHLPCLLHKGSKLGTGPIVRFETTAHRFGVMRLHPEESFWGGGLENRCSEHLARSDSEFVARKLLCAVTTVFETVEWGEHLPSEQTF